MRSTSFLLLGVLALSCKKPLRDGTSDQRTVDQNLHRLVEAAKSSLTLPVNARFAVFGPLPSARPWESPVPAGGPIAVPGGKATLQPGPDGRLHERYDVRPCPLLPVFECVEILATGRFGKRGEIKCFGLQLQKHPDGVVTKDIGFRPEALCPHEVTPGAAQQVIRGVENAQLKHFERQETDKYVDPTAP